MPLESIVYVWCKNHECLMSNGVDIGFGVDEWNRRHEDKRVAELEAKLEEMTRRVESVLFEKMPKERISVKRFAAMNQLRAFTQRTEYVKEDPEA